MSVPRSNAENQPLLKAAIKGGLGKLGLLSIQESGSRRVHDLLNKIARAWIRGLPSLKARWMERSLREHYARKQAIEWYGPKAPLWYDHRTDLHTWNTTRNSQWLERGVYAREVISSGCSVLDLCCADGFYPYHFFSLTAAHVDAVDFSGECIERARAAHASEVIEYHCMDIVESPFPKSSYDVVTWDASIQYFDENSIHTLCDKIALAIGEDGVLSGSAKIADHTSDLLGERHHFSSSGELRKLLEAHFPYVAILETVYPQRRNLYFRCAAKAERLGGFVR